MPEGRFALTILIINLVETAILLFFFQDHGSTHKIDFPQRLIQ